MVSLCFIYISTSFVVTLFKSDKYLPRGNEPKLLKNTWFPASRTLSCQPLKLQVLTLWQFGRCKWRCKKSNHVQLKNRWSSLWRFNGISRQPKVTKASPWMTDAFTQPDEVGIMPLTEIFGGILILFLSLSLSAEQSLAVIWNRNRIHVGTL